MNLFPYTTFRLIVQAALQLDLGRKRRNAAFSLKQCANMKDELYRKSLYKGSFMVLHFFLWYLRLPIGSFCLLCFSFQDGQYHFLRSSKYSFFFGWVENSKTWIIIHLDNPYFFFFEWPINTRSNEISLLFPLYSPASFILSSLLHLSRGRRTAPGGRTVSSKHHTSSPIVSTTNTKSPSP